MYFHSDDPVSIHTLTAAAYNVLRDVNKRRGNDPVLLKEQLITEFIRPEMRDEFRKVVNQAENFFKHADRDSEGSLSFRPSQSEMMLWEAIDIYQRLTGEITPLIHLYRGWYMMHHQHFFTNMPHQDKVKLSLGYAPNERGRYFAEMLPIVYQYHGG